MKNFERDGKHIAIPTHEAVKSGQLLIIGDLVGVCVHDAAPGEPVTLSTQGVYRLPKDQREPVALGDVAYFDGAAKSITTTGEHLDEAGIQVHLRRIGVIVRAEPTESETCLVMLK